jgi:antitoxin component of MazEF toxin-antitoxin module
VALPAELMKAVDLQPGDAVYLQANPDVPGTLMVVPMEIATRWFEAGRRTDDRERSTRDPAGEI